MPASSVVTVRLAPELLAALKAKVRREGTTVSATIVRLVSAEVKPARRVLKRPTMGMFAGQFEDLELDDLKNMRQQLSSRMLASVRSAK